MSTGQRVSSARASEIVGVGYEGFRSYLKRGLLGRVGMLPGFYQVEGSSSDAPAPRAGWQMFGFADLCLMRLAKMLMDNGFSFASASAVVSQHDLWTCFQYAREPADRYLLLWPPYGDHILFEPSALPLLPARMKEAEAHGVTTLINLGEIHRYVDKRLQPCSPSPSLAPSLATTNKH